MRFRLDVLPGVKTRVSGARPPLRLKVGRIRSAVVSGDAGVVA
jgi:hypothetical protein